MIQKGYLFDAPPPIKGERFDTLFANANVRIVRIVSTSDIEANLYIQEEDEWVALLKGEATLDIDGTAYRLQEGEWILIPANTPHRVVRVSDGAYWLAVHM